LRRSYSGALHARGHAGAAQAANKPAGDRRV